MYENRTKLSSSSWLLILFFLVWAFSGCVTDPVIITATPEDPTPTQERPPTPDPWNPWDISCLEPGQEPENPNPCLSGIETGQAGGVPVEYPSLFSVWFDKNPDNVQGEIQYAPISYQDGGFVLDMLYWQGYAGFDFAPFYPEPGICYLLIVEGHANVNYRDYHDAAANFYIVARVFPNDGSGPITLGEQPWVEDYNQPWSTISGPRQRLFPFYTLKSNVTLLIQAGVRAIWPSGGHGSYFRFDSIRLIRPNDIGHCANMPGI